VSEQAEGGNARPYVSPSIRGLIKVLAVPANVHLVRVEATVEYPAHWGSPDMYGQGNGDGPEVQAKTVGSVTLQSMRTLLSPEQRRRVSGRMVVTGKQRKQEDVRFYKLVLSPRWMFVVVDGKCESTATCHQDLRVLRRKFSG
jgi:hypothetical protein